MAPSKRQNAPSKRRVGHVPKQRTRKRNQKKRSRGFLTEMSLLRNKQKAQRYPYHEGPQVGDSYKRNAYLYFAPNVPQRLFDDVMDGSGSGSGKSKSKESWDDILETSKKFEEKQKKRKKEKPPSVKEVREHLRHMVNFSTSHYEKEFKSAYPLLKRGGGKESDSEDEGSEGDNDRGTVDLRRKNIQKIGDKLHSQNRNIPAHRK